MPKISIAIAIVYKAFRIYESSLVYSFAVFCGRRNWMVSISETDFDDTLMELNLEEIIHDECDDSLSL